MGRILDSLLHPPARQRPQVSSGESIIKPIATTGLGLDEDHHHGEIPYIEIPDPLLPGGAGPQQVQRDSPKPGAGNAVTFHPALVSARAIPDHFHPGLIVCREPESVSAKQYHQAAQAIVAELPGLPRSCLLFLLTHDELELHLAALNLTLAMAALQPSTTVIIDTNRDNNHLSSIFMLAPAPGWAECLAGVAVEQVLQETGWPGLHAITAGNRLATATPMKKVLAAERLFRRLQRAYPQVLVLAPGAECTLMAHALASCCDAVCLIASNEPASSEALARRHAELVKHGVRVLGTLVVS